MYIYNKMNASITDALKKSRPNLSVSSLKTYTSILASLHHKLFGYTIDLANFNKTQEIVDYVKDISPNKIKTTLSALVVLTKEDKFRTLMVDKIKDYTAKINTQEKTKAQEDAWIEKDDIDSKLSELKKTALHLYKKDTLNNDDLQKIQQYIILSVMGGVYIPPRRSLDYVKMLNTNTKVKDITKDKDNYLLGNTFHYNEYKTSKHYGEQTLDIPKELKSILTKWAKVNPTATMLFDTNKNPLTNITLNQRINKIFGKKVGSNGIRHTYLTDKYAENSKVRKALAEDMSDMGSSLAQAKTYIKLD